MITCMFSCAGCGLTKKKIEVRCRRPEEDLEHWMNHLLTMITRCHRTVSPKCRSRTIGDLMIPVPTVEGLGVGMEPPTPHRQDADTSPAKPESPNGES